MIPVYIAKLSLKVQKTDIIAQKINSSIFEIFKMVPASFWVVIWERLAFFKKPFY